MEKKDIIIKIHELYADNAFMKLCGIKLLEVSCGKVTVGLSVDEHKHTNINKRLHGGLLMTLMDNATGIAGASLGKRVVTVSMTIDFIAAGLPGSNIEATAVVTHMDSKSLTMTADVRDIDANRLLATSISSMIIMDTFEGIPEKW